MEKTNYPNSYTSLSQEIATDEIDFRDIWNGILRKKKWFALTTGVFFFGSLIFTIHARVFKPIFKGSFTLLTTDPMVPNQSEKNINDTESPLFSSIGNISSNYEINTLITFLKSRISIDQISTDSMRASKGILNVYLTYGNRKIGEKILTRLS